MQVFRLKLWFGVALVVTLISAASAQLPLPTQTSTLFSGSGNCRQCHASNGTIMMENGVDISPVTQWRISMKANGAKDPLWRAKVSQEVQEHPELQALIETKCTRCHAPMGNVQAHHDGATSYSIAQMTQDNLALDGISCTLCHQIQDTLLGTVESFTGHFEIHAMREIYGPYPNPLTMPMMNMVNYMPMPGPQVQDAALCGSCHMLFTPTLSDSHVVMGEFTEQATYYEWRNSIYGAQNITCQTCHMPQSAAAQDIAVMPMWHQVLRSPFWKMSFVGANAYMQRMFRDNVNRLQLCTSAAAFDTAQLRTLAYLQTAATLSGTWAQFGDSLAVDVRLQNNAGHKFPSGIPLRRMWLHVRAEDAEGNVVFESGAWDAAGEIAGLDRPWEVHHQTISDGGQVQVYEDVMLDVNGDVTFGFLRADAYAKDNRLPPAGFASTVSYYDTVAIFGEAASDPDFNREGGGEGTGADIVHYRIPLAARVNVELCYQAVHPRVLEYFHLYSTPEISLLDTLTEQQGLQPLIVTTLTITPALFNLTALADGDSVVLRWLPIPAAAGYRVYAASAVDMQGEQLIGSTAETFYVIAADSERRFFRVTATDQLP